MSLPYHLHKTLPNWIAPLFLIQKDNLTPGKSPFWNHARACLFVASQAGKAVGRIAAIIHKDFEQQDPKIGFFGFLESVDDASVFKVLLDAATQWLQKQGMQQIMGPFSPSLNYELGVLIEGFDCPPKFMMPFQPAYYDAAILQQGFEKTLDFYAYNLATAELEVFPKMQRVVDYLNQRYTITFRNADFSQVEQDAAIIHEIYNDAFTDHWGYTPFYLDEMLQMAKELKALVDRDLFFFVLLDGEIAGFILAIPDLNYALRFVKNGRLFPTGIFKLLYYKRKIRHVRVMNVAVRHTYRKLGLGAILYKELYERMKRKGYLSGEMSWVAEDNFDMNQAAVAMGAKRIKTYRIYKKTIADLD